MSTITALVILIAIGYFFVLVKYRDRIVRWNAIGFGLLGLLLIGLINVAVTLTGIILGWFDLSVEFDIHELGASLSYFLMLAVLVCLFQAMLPVGVVIHRLWPGLGDAAKSEGEEPPSSE